MAHSWCGCVCGFTEEAGMPQALLLSGPKSQMLTRCCCQAPGAVQQLGNGSFSTGEAPRCSLITDSMQGGALSYNLMSR